eukprot:746816-Hanusia_phi.AAC.4
MANHLSRKLSGRTLTGTHCGSQYILASSGVRLNKFKDLIKSVPRDRDRDRGGRTERPGLSVGACAAAARVGSDSGGSDSSKTPGQWQAALDER